MSGDGVGEDGEGQREVDVLHDHALGDGELRGREIQDAAHAGLHEAKIVFFGPCAAKKNESDAHPDELALAVLRA